VQKSMQLSTITHVVAKDTQSTASAKLCFARTCVRRRPMCRARMWGRHVWGSGARTKESWS